MTHVCLSGYILLCESGRHVVQCTDGALGWFSTWHQCHLYWHWSEMLAATRYAYTQSLWHNFLPLWQRKYHCAEYIENTRWVSFDIKFTRLGFENACWHREACRDIENTRWVSFDIKFTRLGFENACWHREACRAIQQAFSKLSLVNLISKERTWYSIYQFTHCWTLFKLAIMTSFSICMLIQRH